MAEGKLKEDKVKLLISKILLAVAHCHSLNVVHRDLKPENIMVGPKRTNFEQLKLVDFGTAVVSDKLMT